MPRVPLAAHHEVVETLGPQRPPPPLGTRGEDLERWAEPHHLRPLGLEAVPPLRDRHAVRRAHEADSEFLCLPRSESRPMRMKGHGRGGLRRAWEVLALPKGGMTPLGEWMAWAGFGNSGHRRCGRAFAASGTASGAEAQESVSVPGPVSPPPTPPELPPHELLAPPLKQTSTEPTPFG